jgi:hypothetical protein
VGEKKTFVDMEESPPEEQDWMDNYIGSEEIRFKTGRGRNTDPFIPHLTR